jgi:hypothetical protein
MNFLEAVSQRDGLFYAGYNIKLAKGKFQCIWI